MTSVSASFESTLTTDKSQGLLVLLFPNSGGVVTGWLTPRTSDLGPVSGKAREKAAPEILCCLRSRSRFQ